MVAWKDYVIFGKNQIPLLLFDWILLKMRVKGCLLIFITKNQSVLYGIDSIFDLANPYSVNFLLPPYLFKIIYKC